MSRKTGTPHFRLPWKPEDVYRLLWAFYVAEVKYRGRKYIPSDFTLDRIWAVSLALTKENPKFGLMLCGNYGNGKSTMLYAIQSAIGFLRDKKHIDTAQWPALTVHLSKDIARYAKTDYDKYLDIREKKMLGVDDFGEEPREIRDYGDILVPLIDLMEYRYNHQLFTIVTSNLSPEEFESAYNGRVADRFREMFTVIAFGGEKSYRQ